MLPSTIFSRLNKAKEKYTIRPYHPKDRVAATTIFIEGMYEYYQKNNIRAPLPSLDKTHSNILQSVEDSWAIIFAPYVDWAILDDNMYDIENYWSLPRRSIFLVAVDNDTQEVAGTVAIQPGTFLNDDWVLSKNMNYLRGDCEVERLISGNDIDVVVVKNNDEIKNTNTNTNNTEINNNNNSPLPPGRITTRVNQQNGFKPGMGLYGQFMSLCQYGMGSLPNDFYRLDDPSYDEKSYISLPTVLLPDFVPEVTGRGGVNWDGVEDVVVSGELNIISTTSTTSTTPTTPTNPTNPTTPTTSANPTTPTATQKITPPRSKANTTCQCVHNGSCSSMRTAIKASKMSQQALLQYIASISSELNKDGKKDKNSISSYDQADFSQLDLNKPITTQPRSWDSLFCPCVREADGLLNDVIRNAMGEALHQSPNVSDQQSTSLPCPFCIEDARFLVTPFQKNIIMTTSTGVDNTEIERDGSKAQTDCNYTINPILSTYLNCFTSSNLVPLIPNSTSTRHPLKEKLPFWTFIPNGFYRRFQYGLQIDDIDTTTSGDHAGKAQKSQQSQQSQKSINNGTTTSTPSTSTTSRSISYDVTATKYPSPLPVSLTSTTYLDFLLGKSDGHVNFKDYFEEERKLFDPTEKREMSSHPAFDGQISSNTSTDLGDNDDDGEKNTCSTNSTTFNQDKDSRSNQPDGDIEGIVMVIDDLTINTYNDTDDKNNDKNSDKNSDKNNDKNSNESSNDGQNNKENGNEEHKSTRPPATSSPLDPYNSSSHIWQEPPQPHPQPPRVYDELLEKTKEQGDEHNFYHNHIALKPVLETTTPFLHATPHQLSSLKTLSKDGVEVVQLPFSDMAEFRRMSVHRGHRASGLGYLLFITALEVATTVFKFRSIHLSTSRIMDMATRFYHRCGFREALAQITPEEGQFACPTDHFCWDLAQRGVSGQLDWFSYTYNTRGGDEQKNGNPENEENEENEEMEENEENEENEEMEENEENEENKADNQKDKKRVIFVHAQTLPGDHFDQAAQVGDTFLGQGLQQNMGLQDMATKLRQFEAMMAGQGLVDVIE